MSVRLRKLAARFKLDSISFAACQDEGCQVLTRDGLDLKIINNDSQYQCYYEKRRHDS